MSKFEDFIKNNTTFKSHSTQEELIKLKSLQRKKIFDLKILLTSLSFISALVFAILVYNPSQKSNKTVSDSVAENYMVEVFLAVDEETSDSELEESGIL